jgi:hypothetical protein
VKPGAPLFRFPFCQVPFSNSDRPGCCQFGVPARALQGVKGLCSILSTRL